MTSLRSVLVSDITPQTGSTLADYVNCSGGFTCPAGSTLGAADAAGAINPTLTLDKLFASLPAGSIGRQTTIDQIIQAMLPLSDYPWEQLNVQGLQDVAGTGQNVRYHVDFDLDCSIATSFFVHVNLPDGFFAVPGSSAISYAGGAPVALPDPVNASNPVWQNFPGSPCGGSTLTRHLRLDFSSFAGLTLGTQNSSVDVTANSGKYFALDQAPVLVTQNWEPSDDPATAPTVNKDTLVVGHIASLNDVDYFRFPLTGLAPGTKVSAYLKIPGDADLDLARTSRPRRRSSRPRPQHPRRQHRDRGLQPGRGQLARRAAARHAGRHPRRLDPRRLHSGRLDSRGEHLGQPRRGQRGRDDRHARRDGNAVIGVSGYNGVFSSGNTCCGSR